MMLALQVLGILIGSYLFAMFIAMIAVAHEGYIENQINMEISKNYIEMELLHSKRRLYRDLNYLRYYGGK